MESTDGGRWGQNTALWAIVAIIVVIAFLWFCHKSGEDKANLAGSIQNLYGRVNTLEPVVADNVAVLRKVGNTLSASVQGISDIKADVDALDGAVFVPTCGCNQRGGCGCGTEKFRKESTYTLASTTLTEVDTCNN